ncbi:MAG TPA: pyridoxal-dependent decarboxylase, partial [Nannocystaceae bacterium]|nr:pyridoxal-dependent decarboxylase [Nannocystaceae bacterium]
MSELEPDRPTLSAWLEAFGNFALDSLDAIDRTPASGPVGAAGNAIGALVSVAIPEEPLAGGVPGIIDRLDRAAAASLFTIGGSYLAYVPGGGLPAAAIGDFVACMLNRATGVAAAAPALCRLEADVLAWLGSEFGLPATTRGLLTTGGSIANLSAIVTARFAAFGDGGDYTRARVYASGQAHHSVLKAVRLAGIPPANMRTIDVDSRLRLDVEALAAAIASDRDAGLVPLVVVSAAGTTNSGAIDPLVAIGELCRRECVWHHVDAAYGGAFVLCDEGRRRLAGIEAADSITFDPHKGMFLPYGTGCLLVRDGERLRAAHHMHAPYLQDFEALDRAGEPPSPTEYGPELSRDFRGLRLWLPLVLHGAGAFRRALTEKLALATRLHDGLVAADVPIEIVDPPQLSTVTWRLRRHAGETLVHWNARNAAMLARVNARGRVHLSSTV